jgi:hypothetical protein
MAGESYGVRSEPAIFRVESDMSLVLQQGRYIPVFASEVYDQNAYLVEVGLTPINLTSVMIGLCHVPLEVIPSDDALKLNGCESR